MRETAVNSQQPALSRGLIWLQQSLNALAAVICEVLREIFDEAAYTRFLEQNKLANSPQAYAHFMEERDPARKPRCC